MRALAVAVLLAAAFPAALPAQAQRALALDGGLERLSGGYADGRSVTAALTLPRAGGWTRLDATALDRFDQRTVLAGVAAGHDLGERWILTGSLAASSSGLIAPRVSAAALVGRRLGAGKRVVASLGSALHESRDGHLDVAALGELAVYLDGAVLQAGGRVSQNHPGPVWGGAAFLAATVGAEGERQLLGRMGVAREAWVVLAPETRLDVGFRSVEASATWREPVAGPWSATLTGGVYANPYYTRVTVRTGLVRRF